VLFIQALGLAVKLGIEQEITHGDGEVKFALAEQLVFAEKTAVTVEFVPLAVNPVIE
jgi:hypothetical protein